MNLNEEMLEKIDAYMKKARFSVLPIKSTRRVLFLLIFCYCQNPLLYAIISI